MIDIHTHILPGIDDGPRDTIGSVGLADVAVASGTTILAATPHVRPDHPRVQPAEIAARVADVNELLGHHHMPLRVVPGGEVDLRHGLELSEGDLRQVTLGGSGRYLLVETPYRDAGPELEPMLAELAGRGFTLVLAHPELNAGLQRAPERIGALAADGVLIQITARSFTAGRRAPERRLAATALEQRWVSVIASDSHSGEWRPPDMRPGLAAAAKAVPGAERELEWLVTAAPSAIIEGRDLPERPSRSLAKRSLKPWR